jgi:hypothetical protein
MPTGDRTITRLNALFSPENIQINAPVHRNKFAPGQGLQISFVFEDDPETKELLDAYVETIPAGISEAFRAAVYQALKGEPLTPVVFVYEPAYDFELRVTQTPNTLKTPGIITIVLRGRYISDPHPLERAMRKARQARPVGADRRSSRSRAKGDRKPAKRRASKRS